MANNQHSRSKNRSSSPKNQNDPVIIAGKFKVLKKIGSGSFGEVFYAVNIVNQKEVAIKIEVGNMTNSQVQYESKVYRFLSDGRHVPFARLYTSSDNKRTLVIDLLGPSLEELYNFCDRKFTMKTVCLLADQLVSVIEYIHYHSIIHCDIKPDNFLVGLGTNSNRVYCIDFGLSKQYRFGTTLAHVKYSNNRSLTGTARYVSINAHVGVAQSRRDDLESIGYVLVYFSVESLPWQGINCQGRKQKYDRICEKKLSTPVSVLCKNLPSEFASYINYCRNLRYDETPDYSYLKKLFGAIIKTLDVGNDPCFDWLESNYLETMKSFIRSTSTRLSTSISSAGHDVKPVVVPVTDGSSLRVLRGTSRITSIQRDNSTDPNKYSFSIKHFFQLYLSTPLKNISTPTAVSKSLQSSSFSNVGFSISLSQNHHSSSVNSSQHHKK